MLDLNYFFDDKKKDNHRTIYNKHILFSIFSYL